MDNLEEWDQSEDHPDFDPNLLANVDSWAVDNDGVDHVHHVNNNDQHSRKSRSHSNQWTNLGVADFEEQDNNNINTATNCNSNSSNKTSSEEQVTISTETVEAAVEAAVAAISETSGSVTSGYSSARINQTTQHHHLHPLGIQSSASCPDHTTTTGTQSHSGGGGGGGSSTHQQHPYPAMSFPQHHHEHQGLCSIDLSQALERSVAAPSSASSTNQNMSSLAANFMMAQSGNSSFIAAAAAAAAASTTAPCATTAAATNVAVVAHQLQQQQQQQQPCTIPSSIKHKTTTTVATSTKINKKKKSNKGRASSRQPKSSVSKTRKKKTASTTTGSSSALPPFYLFDAPVELRANFMQNQRRLGLPIQNDPNSYHYGETVNGFHPHQYQLPLGATETTSTATSAGPDGGLPSPSEGNHSAATVISATGDGTGGHHHHHHRPKHVPQLIDARHGNSNRKNKGGQVKNEREQKRAQKITELIEQLRLQMEDGGWQVEARSKFHTLSNCAEYVKHMITSTSEKEKTNEKLKSDLDEKQRKLEREKEEKAIQEGRSDPESVTSSLTSNMSDNTLCSSRHNEEEKSNKRKLSDDTDQEGSSRDTNNKKLCTVSSEATFEESSGSGSGSGSGGIGDGPSAQGCSISKTISTVSDMTSSNRGSSSNNSSSGGGSSDDVPTEQDSPSGMGDGEEQQSTGSISSDVAVDRGKTSRDPHSSHMDVVFNNDKRMGRKRPPVEVTSLERSFELNYEEVFDKSNIPQLIASTSGKIVTWNECFAKATGYRKSEIERMTIFSLVKPENLAKFFEIVAVALRPPDDDIEKNNDTANEESKDISPEKDASTTPVTTLNGCSKEKEGDEVDINDDSGKSTKEDITVNSTEVVELNDKEENEATPEHLLDYTTMTLPCVDFPGMRKRNQAAAAADPDSVAIPSLHVTITLMPDKDPRRRCFHCVFTNTKGANKKMGIITPKLLASLFAKPSRRRRKHHSSHGRQRKRARGSNENHSVKQISNEQPECPPSPLLMPPPYGKEEQMKEQDSTNSMKSDDIYIEEMSIDDIM